MALWWCASKNNLIVVRDLTFDYICILRGFLGQSAVRDSDFLTFEYL